MINVIIADDHQMFIDGIKSLLINEPDIEIIGEALNGKQVLEKLENAPCDLVLMDINMPVMDGIEATSKLKEKFPQVTVLILSMFNEKEMSTRILEAGAAGYILKNTGKAELIKAIHHVVDGSTYYSNAVTDTIMASLRPGAKDEDENELEIPLTRREMDVLKLIVHEGTTSEIADQLHISTHTVETHRKNLLAKLQVRNTAGLVKWAIANGIGVDD